MDSKLTMSTSEQITILIEEGIIHTGEFATITEVAKEVGISHQGMMNLVQGKSNNPRLHTLQALCRLYGITLDYFACTTKEECQHYVIQHQRTPLLDEIAEQSAQLSPKGERNVLSLLEWIRIGKGAYLAQQQRKSH